MKILGQNLQKHLKFIKQQLYSSRFIHIKIRVSVKKSKTELYDMLQDGTLKIALRKAPEKGQANEELIKYVSTLLNTPRRNIEIVQGLTQKNKLLKISNTE